MKIDNTTKKYLIGGGVIIVGLGFLLYPSFKKRMQETKDEIEQQQQQRESGTKGADPAHQLAARIYTAIGYWNTDEDALYKIAAEIGQTSTFANVAKAYKNLYGNDLVQELTSWEGLDEDELKEFYRILNASIPKTGGGGTTWGIPIEHSLTNNWLKTMQKKIQRIS